VPFVLCYAIRLQLRAAAKPPARVVSSDDPTPIGAGCADILAAETARGRSAPRHTKLHGISLEMKKPLAQLGLGAWNRLLDSTVKDNIPTPTASLAHPQAINCGPALIAAFAICGVLGGISLLVPPFIASDSGHGFLAWRGTLLGAVNSIIVPDRSNIARDTVGFPKRPTRRNSGCLPVVLRCCGCGVHILLFSHGALIDLDERHFRVPSELCCSCAH
jgi:hypothetical protein